jgi:hypothetical protein
MSHITSSVKLAEWISINLDKSQGMPANEAAKLCIIVTHFSCELTWQIVYCAIAICIGKLFVLQIGLGWENFGTNWEQNIL